MRNEYRIRMYLMLLLMRMVSYEDHCSNEARKVSSKKVLKKQDTFQLNLIDLLAYLLEPSTLLLNVWHPYSGHKLISLKSHSILSSLFSQDTKLAPSFPDISLAIDVLDHRVEGRLRK